MPAVWTCCIEECRRALVEHVLAHGARATICTLFKQGCAFVAGYSAQPSERAKVTHIEGIDQHILDDEVPSVVDSTKIVAVQKVVTIDFDGRIPVELRTSSSPVVADDFVVRRFEIHS